MIVIVYTHTHTHTHTVYAYLVLYFVPVKQLSNLLFCFLLTFYMNVSHLNSGFQRMMNVVQLVNVCDQQSVVNEGWNQCRDPSHEAHSREHFVYS